MQDATAKHLDYCTYCPKMCRHACPVATATGCETFIPQAKMATLAGLRKGQKEWTTAASEPLWACTTCAHCAMYCQNGVTPGPTLLGGRAEAVARGQGHSALAHYPDRFRARDERLARLGRELLPQARFAEGARVGLWPSCDAIEAGGADVRLQLDLLDRLGAGHVRLVAAERSCGGYPLLAAGHPEAFRWHAARVAAELSGFRTVVMTCSACVFTLRKLYPAEGVSLPVEILHLVEYLAKIAPRLGPGTMKAGPVYYHDPCFLARHLEIVEAPRRLLAQVAEVREFVWSGPDTECCGGGGLLPKTMPQVADSMARYRLREVIEAGGGTVATSCPTCQRMLARNAPDGVVVRDLVELIEERTRNTAT